MKRNWKLCLASLVIGALLTPLSVHGEKGAESYTHIHREQHQESISITETRSESTSKETSKGSYVTGPSVSGVAIIVTDVVDIPLPEKTPKDLPSYRERGYEEDGHFFEKGFLAVVKEGKKWGILDTKGNVSLAPTYKILDPQKDGLFLAGNKEKDRMLIDGYGHPVSPMPTYDGPLAYKEQGLYGFKNRDGSVLIAPRFQDILTNFSEGIAFVKTMSGEKIAIDENGRALFSLPYDDISPYQYGVAEYRRKVSTFSGKNYVAVALGGLFGGKKMDDFAYHKEFSGIKRGFIDKEGHVVIDSKNDQVWPMTAYGTLVKNDGRLSFVSPEGKTLIPPAYRTPGSMSRRDGLIALRDEGTKKYGVFDMKTGQQILDFLYEDISFLGFDRAYTEDGDKRQFIDVRTGRILADLPAKSKVVPFNDEPVTWVYRIGEYYAIIDTDGNFIYEDTKSPLKDVSEFRHGYCVAKQGKKWGIMKSDGTWLVPPTYDDADILP